MKLRMTAGGLIAEDTTSGRCHAVWTFDDLAQSAQQRAHFAKNLAILGGLILAALPPEDDEYRPKERSMDIARKPKQPTGHASLAGGISEWRGRSNFSRRGGGR
jgi:hypothetical protein